MKRTGFLINIGRGMATKLDDMVAAMQTGEIAGAAFDVYEPEPLPSTHPSASSSDPKKQVRRIRAATEQSRS